MRQHNIEGLEKASTSLHKIVDELVKDMVEFTEGTLLFVEFWHTGLILTVSSPRKRTKKIIHEMELEQLPVPYWVYAMHPGEGELCGLWVQASEKEAIVKSFCEEHSGMYALGA